MNESARTEEMAENQRVLDEVYKAFARLRGRQALGYPVTDEWLRWVLAFGQRDLGALSQGEWLNLQYELVACMLLGEPLSEDPRDVLPVLRLIIPALTAPDVMYALQAYTQHQLQDLLATRCATFELGETAITVHAVGPVGKRLYRAAGRKVPHGGYVTIVSRSPEAAFRYALMSLVKNAADRIHRCEGCEIIFLADRIDQRYHDRRCLSRATTQQYRMTLKAKGKRRLPQKKRTGRSGGRLRKSSLLGNEGARHGTKRR